MEYKSIKLRWNKQVLGHFPLVITSEILSLEAYAWDNKVLNSLKLGFVDNTHKNKLAKSTEEQTTDHETSSKTKQN